MKGAGTMAALAAATLPADAGGERPPAAPVLTYAFSARVTLAPPIEYGMVDGKRTRFIAVTGGSVTGPRLQGVVLPGGGDHQAIGAGGVTDIHARYSLKATDGSVIAVDNPGIRVASPEVLDRLARGEDVDPALYYFRTTPTFIVAEGPHAWLRRSVFVARGIRKPDHVAIDFYTVG